MTTLAINDARLSDNVLEELAYDLMVTANDSVMIVDEVEMRLFYLIWALLSKSVPMVAKDHLLHDEPGVTLRASGWHYEGQPVVIASLARPK